MVTRKNEGLPITVLKSKAGEVRQVYNGAPPLGELVTGEGQTWLEYRKTLIPDYRKAWREIASCYLMLGGGYAVNAAVAIIWGALAGLLIVPLTALWLGFWLHALNQFAHDGAHGNLAQNRKKNDLLSDWLLWSFFAQTVRTYRKSHMQHHIHLGDHQDTEINYHECMNPWFLVKGITGLQMILMLVRYVLKPKGQASGTNVMEAQREMLFALVRTGLLYGAVITASLLLGFYGPALACLLAVAVVYPCLGTTRQILEHRALEAPCGIDFTQVEHGPVNRLFGDDLFSRHFGAAGLNRHLLHHWDPGISYTRLPEMEEFVLRTPYAAAVVEGRSSYFKIAGALLRSARNK